MKTFRILFLPMIAALAFSLTPSQSNAQGGLEISIAGGLPSAFYEGYKTDRDCAGDDYVFPWTFGTGTVTTGYYISPQSPSAQDRTVRISVTDDQGNTVTVVAPGFGSPNSATMPNGEVVTFHSEDGCTGHPAVVTIN